jgi:hypothetical protein
MRNACVFFSVPRSSSRDSLFAGLPVLVVDDWAELAGPGAPERLAAWHRQLAPLFEGASGREVRRRLTVEHWVGKVAAIQTELREGR